MYSKVIAMCVESSALIVILGGLCIVLGFLNANGLFVPLLLFPHICVGGLEFYDMWCISKFFSFMLLQVISPLLIVYRVAKGRAMTTTIPKAMGSQDSIDSV